MSKSVIFSILFCFRVELRESSHLLSDCQCLHLLISRRVPAGECVFLHTHARHANWHELYQMYPCSFGFIHLYIHLLVCLLFFRAMENQYVDPFVICWRTSQMRDRFKCLRYCDFLRSHIIGLTVTPDRLCSYKSLQFIITQIYLSLSFLWVHFYLFNF